MNKIIESFIKLTDYTYIYGDEHELEKYLPDGIQQDTAGNYYIKIGESETMFCSHLDTAAFQKEKVEHEFWKDKTGDLFVGTKGEVVDYTYTDKSGVTHTVERIDGTLLGADDKTGVVIMLDMIEKNVPGLYYFFIGEEVGRVGSRAALNKHRDIFKEYKRCIAFDRRAYGSIISRQMGMQCCSDDFVNSLSEQFKKFGMDFHDDKGGIYTDSATFMDIIPECTNLSVGYFNEHSESEFQNLTYLIKLAKTATKIDWESLPTKRNPNPFKTADPKRRPKGLNDLSDDELWDIFIDVDDALESIAGVYCKNYKDFIPEKEMVYLDWYSDNITPVWIHEDGTITVNKQKFSSQYELKQELLNYFGDKNFSDEDDEEDDEQGKFKEHDTFYDDFEDDGIEDEKVEEVDDFDKMVSDFKKNLNIQKFLSDVISFSESKNKKRLSAVDMKNILDKYDKSIESFIYWLFSMDNDPKKTSGITWDDDKGQFVVE